MAARDYEDDEQHRHGPLSYAQ